MATKARDNRILTLIGGLKLINAALLIALGVGVFKLLHRDVADVVQGTTGELILGQSCFNCLSALDDPPAASKGNHLIFRGERT